MGSLPKNEFLGGVAAFAKTDLSAAWRTTVTFTAAPCDSFGKRGSAVKSQE